MRLSISHQQQHIVDFLTLLSLAKFFELLQHRTKVGWTAELDAWKSLLVNSYHPSHALNFRLLHVSCQGKAVTQHMVRHVACDSTESINWEITIRVVLLEYTANLND